MSSFLNFLKGKKALKLKKNKSIIKNKQTISLFPSEGDKLVFPLSQHKGAPAISIVNKGDFVLSGQKIAEGRATVSAHIHSSISGVVFSVSEKEIIIESDGLMQEIEFQIRENYLDLNKDEYLNLIKEAAIVGWGGAGFPTSVKLNPPTNHKIDTIIINGAECEPYLASDFRMMIENSESVFKGAEILLKLFPDAKLNIAIETDKMEAIELYKKMAKENNKISVAELKPTYPMGSEKQLVEIITGRQVASGSLPSTAGCVIVNISSAAAIFEAIRNSRPHNYRYITLSGKAFKNPGAYKIPIGMTISQIVEKSGGFDINPVKLLSGGPMMGQGMFTLESPIIKPMSGVLAFTEDEAKLPDESPCIRCSACVEYCPIGLMPYELNRLALAGQDEKFMEINGMDCIECGVCSYVCPSNRHLTQSFSLMKKQIFDDRAKQAASDKENQILNEAMKEIKLGIGEK